MDPLTLFLLAWRASAEATKAAADMITALNNGAPENVRAQAWLWWMEDQTRWRADLDAFRKWLRIDALLVSAPPVLPTPPRPAHPPLAP